MSASTLTSIKTSRRFPPLSASSPWFQYVVSGYWTFVTKLAEIGAVAFFYITLLASLKFSINEKFTKTEVKQSKLKYSFVVARK